MGRVDDGDAVDARHMTEFTGLDIEMTFKDHYHEARRPGRLVTVV